MKKRLLLKLGLLALMGAGLFCLSLWLILPHGVTKATFDRIQRGMTVNEVRFQLLRMGRMGPCGEGICPWIWEESGNEIYVHFDQRTGKAMDAFFITGADGIRHARSPL